MNSADGPVQANENTIPYTYTPLSNELGYPSQALSGAVTPPNIAAGQAAARYHAEQAAIQASNNAARSAEAARFNAAAAKIRNGGTRKRG